MKKRWMSLLMAIVMLASVTLFGATAYAEGELTRVGAVSFSIAAPAEGSKAEDLSAMTSVTVPEGQNCILNGASWQEKVFDDMFREFKGTFEAGKTYYMWVELAADSGSVFNQGGPYGYTTVNATGGTPIYDTLAVTNISDSEGNIFSTGTVMVAFTPAPAASFFGVLICDADGSGNTSGSSYWMDYPGMEGDLSRTSSSNNFVNNGSGVYLEAYPAAGYKFVGWYMGDPDKTQGKLYTGEPLTTDRIYRFEAPLSLTMPYLCAVFDVDNSPQGDQVQMWVGNTDGRTGGSTVMGGKVAVKYTPREPNIFELESKDGTNFVAGEILQFYRGDECTVYAKPDEGYRFVGWYHVNIEWAPFEEGSRPYEGEVISTEPSFTYSPGVTMLPGDDEPLRYVCAVFEAAQETGQLLGDVDFDGDVDNSDLIYIARNIVDLMEFTPMQTFAGDMDQDGAIANADLITVARIIVGLEENRYALYVGILS